MNSNTIKKIRINDWVKLPESFRKVIDNRPYVMSKSLLVPVEILPNP